MTGLQYEYPALATEGAGTPAAPAVMPNPLAIESLRLPANYSGGVAIRKELTSVPIRRPNRDEFFRCRPGEDYRIDVAILDLKTMGEMYVVAPSLLGDLLTERTISTRRLVLTTNRNSDLLLWPLRLLDMQGRIDDWGRSAIEAAERAQTKWVRLMADMSLGAYDVRIATGNLPEPNWPDISFEQLLQIAIKDRYIGSLDHPVLRSLRGEV